MTSELFFKEGYKVYYFGFFYIIMMDILKEILNLDKITHVFWVILLSWKLTWLNLLYFQSTFIIIPEYHYLDLLGLLFLYEAVNVNYVQQVTETYPDSFSFLCIYPLFFHFLKTPPYLWTMWSIGYAQMSHSSFSACLSFILQ